MVRPKHAKALQADGDRLAFGLGTMRLGKSWDGGDFCRMDEIGDPKGGPTCHQEAKDDGLTNCLAVPVNAGGGTVTVLLLLGGDRSDA